MDVSPFMGERRAKTVLHVGYVKPVRDFNDRTLAGREFSDAFDIALFMREVGVRVEVGFLLVEHGKVVGPDREIRAAVFLLQELHDDALALFIQFLRQIMRRLAKRPVLSGIHLIAIS